MKLFKSQPKGGKSETCDETVFTRYKHQLILQEVLNHKKSAQLGYESLDKPGVFEKKLRGMGYSLELSLSNKETKVFHNPHTKEVTVVYRGTALFKQTKPMERCA